MYLSSLQLHNYRNYSNTKIEPSRGLNIVYGENAQGKTNLLEAINLLATGRSHRTSRDQDLIRQGDSTLVARALVQRTTGPLSLELTLDLEKRKDLRINGVQERRIIRLVGTLATVLFSPDDLNLLKGPPVGRRKFLDIELSQISQTYLHTLVSYNKVVSQRNSLLRNGTVDTVLLGVLDEQLVMLGAQLIVRRAETVSRLHPLARDYHGALSESRENLKLAYMSLGAEMKGIPELSETQDEMTRQLRQRKSEELRRQVTLVGPHRDDLALWIDDADARAFASQGQQRTAVLALKLAELQFMTDELGETPLLLLDDVASELDPIRRHYLLQSVQDHIQTFITCTDLADLRVRSWPKEHRLFRIRGGTVHLEEGGLD